MTEEIVTQGVRNQNTGAFDDPQVLQMLENRLGSLVGQASNYIASLPVNVRQRIHALKNLQSQNVEIEAEFHKEVLELEKKYLVRHNVLYSKREKIISGEYEPTEEETKRDEEDGMPPAPEVDESFIGIPEFWCTALKNLPPLRDTITEKDEEALKNLSDIKYRFLDGNPGFALDFYFKPNEYFSNEVLTKTYFLEYSPDSAEEIYDHAEGTVIDWKEGKDLSVKVEIKKQVNKATKKTRTVKKTIPVDTFFNFFSPMQPPSPEEEADLDDDDYQKFEIDYDVGEMIKERLIPNAVDWFTGQALQEYDEESEGSFDEYDEDDDGILTLIR
jgi:nucleosome assembly protein 1-like 1